MAYDFGLVRTGDFILIRTGDKLQLRQQVTAVFTIVTNPSLLTKSVATSTALIKEVSNQSLFEKDIIQPSKI